MQVEFIGCTSAGKSTFARHILQGRRKQGVDIFLGEDFILAQFGLNWIKNSRLRRFFVNLIALLASLITWRRNGRFYRFATQFLFQLPISRMERLALLRNVLKKIGNYEIIRFCSSDRQLILVDEGVLQIAHNLFVHASVEVEGGALATFAGLVPISDVVVYFKQPEALLIGRVMNRGHRRIPACAYEIVVPFVKQAVSTFDRLVQHPSVAKRVLVVNGSQAVSLAANIEHEPALRLALEIMRSSLSGDTSIRSGEEVIYVE